MRSRTWARAIAATGAAAIALPFLFAGAPAGREGAAPRPATQPATLPAGGAASGPATNPTTNPATFKVATFNILYTNPDLKAIARIIRQADADILCLQETNAQSERFIREQFGKSYPHMTFQAGGGAGGFGILSKVPLRNVKHLPAKFGWFGTHLCEANLAGRAVQIVDVHLLATLPPAGAGVQDLLKLWAQTEAIRAREIAHILENTSARLPRIIAGDLNAQPDGKAPEFLKGKGFIDSLASVRQDHREVTTWKGTFQGVSVGFRIDYIFHTKDIVSTACQVLPTDASDHALVVSTLRWAGPASRPASGTAPAERR